jgi:hypothetical protein
MLDHIAIATREAAARPTSWDPKARTVEAVIATSAPVARRDAAGEFLEILDVNGADLSALRGASVLDGHMPELRSVIGTVEDCRVEGNEIVARLRMSERSELAPLIRDIESGIVRHLSVGYSVDQVTEGTKDGKRTKTATRWTPREVSFVAVPADRNAHTRTNTMPTERGGINRQIRELASLAGATSTITDDLIDREATVDQARAVLFDHMARRSSSVSIMPTHNRQTFDNPEFFREAAADALYTRIDPTATPSEAARQFVGLSLVEIGRHCLQRSGMSTSGLGADSIVTRALESSSDYPNMLANLLNKSLRVAYEAAPSGLKDVARQTSAVDFRAKSRIQLDSTGFKLEPVTEDGEFRHGSMVDAAESYSVSTFGKIFGITRKVIVNDDLDAFGSISRRMGVAAAQFEAQTLADLLLSNSGLGPTMNDDGNTLFHAVHVNYASTGAPPDVPGLTAARLSMRHQVGKGGGLISVTPSILLVPAELETTGEQLITEIRPVVVGEVNPFSKLTALVVEPRLPATAWYLVASPGEIDGLEYCYLSSSPGPQLQSRLGFDVDGLEVRVRLDYGCGFVDWRGWYKNKGAA